MRSRVKSQRENPRASSAASTCASSAFNVVVSPFLALPLRGGRLSGPTAPGVLLSSETFELRGDARDVRLGGGLAGADLLDHGLGGLGEERLVAELLRRAVEFLLGGLEGLLEPGPLGGDVDRAGGVERHRDVFG